MTKKKWDSIFTITLVFVVCCLMATGSWAAKKIEFYSANAKNYIRLLNENGNNGMGTALGLGKDEGFDLIRQGTDFNGVTHYRYQQTYKGIPVWGMQIIVSKCKSGKVVKLHGTLVKDSSNDVGGFSPSLDPLGALRRMQDLHKQRDIGAAWNFRNEKYETNIYIDKNDKAHLCYVVSFFADTQWGNPSRFIHFIDVNTGKVLDSFDMLNYADGVGPGGNLKVGYYYYGTDYGPFGVTENAGTCTMDTPDVKTVDLNHGTTGTTPYSYTCYENTHEEINGAYCPLNDAQYFGQAVYDMYITWYGVPPLPFKLTLRCHYSTNYENAFWDGSSMTFGDGYTTFYPLVALDIIAHEVSHGFTEFNSGLINSGQPGGINAAFSDIAGEAAKYYMKGSNNFMFAYDIFKNPTQALRYLYDPPLDGISIDHIDDYYEGMYSDYSSGIFNKAFYLIATTPGWNTKMAFDIFVWANHNYWIPSSTFIQGAEGVVKAAVDYGYPRYTVINAFAQVGINIVWPEPPIADFSACPVAGGAPLTVIFTDQSQGASSWLWDFGDGGTSTLQDPTHTYNSMGAFTVTLTASNAYGSDTEVKTDYIIVASGEWVEADFTASAAAIFEGETVTFTDQSIGIPDPDTWEWVFEGGTPGTSTQQNPTVTYNTAGTYTVTLTAFNGFDSDTETKVGYINVTEKPNEIFVNDITQTIRKKGKNYESSAMVTIWDIKSAPVADATVFITWAGVVTGSDSGVTGPDGTVKFESDRVRSTGPFTITVDNVTHPVLPYNPALNNETSDTAVY